MTFSKQFLDDVRAKTTLSALIGKTHKLTRSGQEYKACCPFHDETTPSFTVNDLKGFWHCFGCSKHGDAIRWMTDQRGLTFVDAVKQLASDAGVPLPAPNPRAARKAARTTTLLDLTADAQRWFTDHLDSEAGKAAFEYLHQRGFSPSIIKEFGLGFAPDSRDQLKSALLPKHSLDCMVEAGLVLRIEKKPPYDRFRGRVMVPIKDARGRVIAFGGRNLDGSAPKYMNSPETPLFDKGRTLFNLDRASPASRETDRVIVVEGYLDVISLAQAGYNDVVAPLGTALSAHQLEILWRLSATPILCFDGDEAGRKAAMRAARLALPILKPGYSLQFVQLPEGQDPDDIVMKAGAPAFDMMLANAIPLADALWNYEYDAMPLKTPEQRAALKYRLIDIVQQITDPDIADHYGRLFRERYDALFQPTGQNAPDQLFFAQITSNKINIAAFPSEMQAAQWIVDQIGDEYSGMISITDGKLCVAQSWPADIGIEIHSSLAAAITANAAQSANAAAVLSALSDAIARFQIAD